jgi:hypothetical protein
VLVGGAFLLPCARLIQLPQLMRAL